MPLVQGPKPTTTGHIIGYYREAMAYKTLDALRRRGFDVKQ